jgi:SAM-dependent methyltransferase
MTNSIRVSLRERLLARVIERWRRLNADAIGTPRYWDLAVQNRRAYADLASLVSRYVSGTTLDLGAGQLAWRELLQGYASSYTSTDLIAEHASLDVLANAAQGLPFQDRSFNAVFCCSVLEHMRAPWLALPEVHRVLKPGGMVIVSVPFMFYLHGAPQDYYRFTGQGLKVLAELADLDVVHLQPSGGLAHLLLNVPSLTLSSLVAELGYEGLIPKLTNILTRLADGLARAEPRGLFALNELAVLRRRSHGEP